MTATHHLGAALSLALLAVAPRAQAALGEPASSVPSDRAALRAVDRGTTVRKGYSVQELQVGPTRVREFVSPSGVVFAVAWKGLTHPDLGVLLGRYAAEYQAGRREGRAPAGRRHQRTETAHAVVETWGHMRDLQGRAYVPALLPPGVAPDDLS